MNKVVIIAVFIFWVALSFFYASSLVKQNFIGNGDQTTVNTNVNPNNNTDNTLAEQLASHNKKNDCWLAIDGKVYQVTDYISQHPGGAGEIIKYCGQDATKAFGSKDKFVPQNHSQFAYSLLDDYYIGDLNTLISGDQLLGTNTNGTSSGGNNQAKNLPTPVSYTLTSALVAQHNVPSDCWVTANNNVYNVTGYIRAHPGGASAITSYCGADIAAAFAGQGHSQNATNIMASYKIGILGSTVDNTIINSVNNNTVNTGRGDDDEDEEDDD